MSERKSSRGPCTVEGCGNEENGRGLCAAHRRRLKLYGDVHALKQPHRPIGLSTVEALWLSIDKDTDPGGCWEWTAYRNEPGYGIISFGQKRYLAHRILWQELNRPLAPGEVVRHRCDNPPCCRPDHLEPGTARDNAMDSVNRGRAHRSKNVTDEQVIEMRDRYANGESSRMLAEDYGTTRMHVVEIVTGRSRKYLPGAVPDIARSRQSRGNPCR